MPLEAVADGHLVPPRAVSVPLRFQREGIKYEDLSEEEKEQWDALEWNEDGTTPDAVDSSARNKWLFNTDTVDRVLAHLMTKGQKCFENKSRNRVEKSMIIRRQANKRTVIIIYAEADPISNPVGL